MFIVIGCHVNRFGRAEGLLHEEGYLAPSDFLRVAAALLDAVVFAKLAPVACISCVIFKELDICFGEFAFLNPYDVVKPSRDFSEAVSQATIVPRDNSDTVVSWVSGSTPKPVEKWPWLAFNALFSKDELRFAIPPLAVDALAVLAAVIIASMRLR